MTLEAGPKTDLAVANACGIEVESRTLWMGFETVTGIYRRSGADQFRPSTDIADAFTAAEAFRKGDRWPAFRIMQQRRLGQDWGEKWGMFTHDDCGGEWSDSGLYSTAALAICACILAEAK